MSSELLKPKKGVIVLLRKENSLQGKFNKNIMPVRKVKGGYQWGTSGKVYPTREQAEKQGAAIYAAGYKSKSNKK